MKNFIKILGYFLFAFSLVQTTQAEQLTSAESRGFIADDLFIYMHAGPGTNYRILGTINAGSQVIITGNSDKEYSEIIDGKGRKTWVKTKYINDKPGIRSVLTELQNKVSESRNYASQLDGEINTLKAKLANLTKENNSLTKRNQQFKDSLSKTNNKLKTQGTSTQKQAFFNGAIVLGIGLFLGLILPRIFTRRKSSMDSWK